MTNGLKTTNTITDSKSGIATAPTTQSMAVNDQHPVTPQPVIPSLVQPVIETKDKPKNGWAGIGQGHRLLMVAISVLVFSLVALVIVYINKPKAAASIVSRSTTTPQVVTIIPFTVTPTVVPNMASTAVSTKMLTVEPTSLPTIAATKVVEISCKSDPAVMTKLKDASLKINKPRNLSQSDEFSANFFRFQSFKAGNDQTIYVGWAITTGKIKTQSVDVNGKVYQLHIATALVASKNETADLLEIQVVYALIDPSGKYILINPVKYENPEYAKPFEQFGFLFNLTFGEQIEKDGNVNWGLLAKGGEDGTITLKFREIAQVAQVVSKQQTGYGETIDNINKGIQPDNNWLLMAGAFNTVATKDGKSVDLGLICKP